MFDASHESHGAQTPTYRPAVELRGLPLIATATWTDTTDMELVHTADAD